MIARTSAVIEPGGVLGPVSCAPPLTLRQVHGEQVPHITPAPHDERVPHYPALIPRDERWCELRLVGTAAGPLAGDDLALSLRLRPGARAALRAAGASVAQGGGGERRLTIRAELGDGAELVAEPGALIACAGSRVDVRVEIALGAGAAVRWRELVVLGRTGEPSGEVTLRWDVTRGGEPVLRQSADLGPGQYGGKRILACALISDPAVSARTAVESATAVAQRAGDGTVLVTVLDDDAARAVRRLADLSARALI